MLLKTPANHSETETGISLIHLMQLSVNAFNHLKKGQPHSSSGSPRAGIITLFLSVISVSPFSSANHRSQPSQV